jgi:hypothetical protein
MPDKGQHLDLSSGAEPPASRVVPGPGGKFLGVHFMCCDVYARVYPNREQTAYEGRCPRCGKQVEFRIGAGGTDARFFQAF